MRLRGRLGVVLVALTLSACGGNVNLGERTAPPPDSDEPLGPDAPVGRLVAQLTDEIQVDLMAAADDFLYVGNFSELSRCRKSNCLPTLELLPGVGPQLAHLQVHGRSLGIAYAALNEARLSTYSLPTVADERVVLRDLPTEARKPTWYGDFVYWGLDVDSSVYRCRLPSCDGGPERLGGVGNLRGIQAGGELVFWNDDTFIYRAESFGAGPLARLLPDDLLSEAPPEPAAQSAGPDLPLIQSIALGAGTLYASLDGLGCHQGCTYPIVGWPVAGGARETILNRQHRVEQIFVFGHELVWTEVMDGAGTDDAYPLWSCLVQACDSTRRKLGHVLGNRRDVVVIADDSDLYWLEAGPGPDLSPQGTVRVINAQIRRAPRLETDTP